MKILSSVALTCALLAIAVGIDAPRANADPYELLASNSSAQNGGQDNDVASPPEVQSHVSEPGLPPRTAVVLRFAVESQPVTDTSALSAQACPETSAPSAPPTTATPSTSVDPKILNEISGEMQKRLSKK